MRELIADRMEGDTLVCFCGEEVIPLCCGRIARPEGRRVMLFDELGPKRFPYVTVSVGALRLTGCERAAFIFPPDEKRRAKLQSRFDALFGKRR